MCKRQVLLPDHIPNFINIEAPRTALQFTQHDQSHKQCAIKNELIAGHKNSRPIFAATARYMLQLRSSRISQPLRALAEIQS